MITNLHIYDDAILTLLEGHVPAWRAAIAAERQRRADWIAFWNDPRAIRQRLKQQLANRQHTGYSANEEARGIDERESDDWQAMRERINELMRQRRNQRARERRHRQRERLTEPTNER